MATPESISRTITLSADDGPQFDQAAAAELELEATLYLNLSGFPEADNQPARIT